MMKINNEQAKEIIQSICDSEGVSIEKVVPEGQENDLIELIKLFADNLDAINLSLVEQSRLSELESQNAKYKARLRVDDVGLDGIHQLEENLEESQFRHNEAISGFRDWYQQVVFGINMIDKIATPPEPNIGYDGICLDCGSWSPEGHSEAHEHDKNCSYQIQLNKWESVYDVFDEYEARKTLLDSKPGDCLKSIIEPLKLKVEQLK